MAGKLRFYKRIFVIGAVWNCSCSLLFFFWANPIFVALKMAPLNYPEVMQMLVSLTFVFGLGYYRVSQDPNKNHLIVELGITGKTIMFLLFTYYSVIARTLSPFFLLFGIVDFGFAVLFFRFLRIVRKKEKEKG